MERINSILRSAPLAIVAGVLMVSSYMAYHDLADLNKANEHDDVASMLIEDCTACLDKVRGMGYGARCPAPEED